MGAACRDFCKSPSGIIIADWRIVAAIALLPVRKLEPLTPHRMQRPFSQRWAGFVTTYWRPIVLTWLVVTVWMRVVAPTWQEIALDGDFEYLPAEMTSVAGGRLLDRAFPQERSRSQVILVLSRSDGSLRPADEIIGLDLLRRLYHRLAEVSWQRAIDHGYRDGIPEEDSAAARWLRLTREALDQSIDSDERFYEMLGEQVPRDPPTSHEPRMAIAYWDRAKLRERLGEPSDEIATDFEAALVLHPELPTTAVPIDQRNLTGFAPLLDVLSWDDQVVGRRLRSNGARLAVMQLSSELAATGNIETVEATEALLQEVMDYSSRFSEPGAELLMTGSAAIGGETLIAARDAIRYTELFTVLMVLTILTVVYRAPLLVLIPILSIGVAVVVSSSLVALLTGASMEGTLPWLDLRVFTTSRIFVVVILFGAGTDYCLFLIARLREEAWKAEWEEACRRALGGVSGALIGSAVTTIAGLGMLWIADFGKFHYTGPIIAICLSIGLLVCTTLTPALLRAVGPNVFWPAAIPDPSSNRVSLGGESGRGRNSWLWSWIAIVITRRPVIGLAAGVLLLAIPGAYGYRHEQDVTYDLSSELDPSAASRRGLRALAEHFPIGEVSPVTVLLLRPQSTLQADAKPIAEETPRQQLENVTKGLKRVLYDVPGVVAVRTADDPLGDFPPDREMGLLQGDAWRRRALQNHRIAQQYFFSEAPAYRDRLTRLDVVIEGDPFSIETADLVSNVRETVEGLLAATGPEWRDTRLFLTGTTPSIMDLRTVTLQDNRRIKLAVIAAVFLVLLLVIRRIGLCIYLIATVLLSYYATLGLTILFFRALQGPDFIGLDWKLPLFLFVILVAVGQDYNVYLVTRILEERRRLGWLSALRRAVARTGGIITACGLVMAGTFFSMTASAWVPPLADVLGVGTLIGEPLASGRTTLRGIVELGFALGLGVLIDTFYVRTILVPSFVAAMEKYFPWIP